MPWHVSHNPSINYEQRILKVGPDVIPAFQKDDEKIQVTNLGVKKFRRMLKNNMKKFELYQVNIREVKHSKGEKLAENNAKLEPLLAEFESVFKTELPPGLPPKRSVDHEIQIEEDSKPPHHPLFQLSPVESDAAKEYVEKLLKSGKIRPSKSPYGASLFFVKQGKGKLRGVVDYRAFDRMNSSVMQKRKLQIKRKVLKCECWVLLGVPGPFGDARSNCAPLFFTKQSNEMYQMEVCADFFLETFMWFLRFSTLVCLFYDRGFAKWF